MPDFESVSSSLINISGLADGGLVAVDAVIDGENESIIVHRCKNAYNAWLNTCPHAGRRLDYAPGKFLTDHGRVVCAAHGASFRLEDGHCVSGPCKGANLRPVAIEVHEGEVRLAGRVLPAA